MRVGIIIVGLTLASSPLIRLQVLPRPPVQTPAPQIQVLDRDRAAVTGLTDGDMIRLRLELSEPSDTQAEVMFQLEGSTSSLPGCNIDQGGRDCETQPFYALGWYWTETGLPSPRRTLQARVAGLPEIGTVSVQMAPRPVVMVHGFSSSWEAWVNYLGPSGYLEADGLPGFAVGDGQVAGVLNTGSLTDPSQETNTIVENGAILGKYMEGVKQKTGAQQVDLVAHSMGGLIARYYIDKLMQARDVAQLIMLGSPMAGTDCADLPASLGLYLPATLEIRPSYVDNVFNVDITHRHGVPFRALAGVPILEGFKAPCTAVPSDLAVSLESVTAIPLLSRQMSVLHMNLNLSREVYSEFVQPLLRTPAGGFPDDPDPILGEANNASLQFSRLFTGHVGPGGTQEVTVSIDTGIALASFALYDTTRSLAVTVRGASGNVIELTAEANGLVVVQDPDTLFYLGYGFQDPSPGVWRVTLQATTSTPGTGADFALADHFVGGATANGQLSTFLPRIGEQVIITADLGPPAAGVALSGAQAVIRRPGGEVETVPLLVTGSHATGAWTPSVPGLHGVDVTLTATGSDGIAIERTVFLAFEAQPIGGLPAWSAMWPCAIVGSILCVAAMVWLRVRRRRRRSSAQA